LPSLTDRVENNQHRLLPYRLAENNLGSARKGKPDGMNSPAKSGQVLIYARAIMTSLSMITVVDCVETKEYSVLLQELSQT
jgi:hypothetical protein